MEERKRVLSIVEKVKIWSRKNICGIMYFMIAMIVLTYYLNLDPVVYEQTDWNIAVPEDFSNIDKYIAEYLSDPVDRYNITHLMPLKKFKKDNLNRLMQKNWNKTLYPLYGGNVLDPIRRKVRISDIEDDEKVIDIKLLKNSSQCFGIIQP